MWFVLFSILMDVVGFGIITPILPFYARSLGAGPELVTLCIALPTGAAFFSTPVWGRLSDRYGRKPIICLGLAGAVVSYGVLALATDIWTIALSRILSGIMAGNISAAYAYVTDSTSDEDRARYMGYAGACFGLGFIVGPALGGWLGGSSFETANFVLPSIVAGALSLVALLCIALFAPESHPAEVRQQTDTAEQPGLIKAIVQLRHRTVLVAILICAALYQAAGGLYEPIFPLWAADLSLIEGPSGMVPMLIAGGAGYMLVQAVLIGPLTRRFDVVVLLRGAALGLMGTTFLVTIAGNASSVPWVIVFFGSIAGCAAVIITSTQTLVSQRADADERGVVLGVFASIGTLGRTGATVLTGVIYEQLHHHAPYLGASLIGLVLFFVACTLRPSGDRSSS